MRSQPILGDVFTSILPLQSMLDKVPLVSLKEAVLELLNVDLSTIDLPPDTSEHMSTLACSRLCDAVLEEARGKSVMSQLPPKLYGMDNENFVGALMVHTMERPFPWYLLYTHPLNIQGVRIVEKIRHQMSFLKLLILSHHIMPRNSAYWNTDPLYRGIDAKKNPALKEKIANYEKFFALGTKITFAAPTSTSTHPEIAADFSDGIQFKIYGINGVSGPGGFVLDELSMYEEREVLMNSPRVFVVTACTKPDSTLLVVIQETETFMSYLSCIEEPRALSVGASCESGKRFMLQDCAIESPVKKLKSLVPGSPSLVDQVPGSPRLVGLLESAGLLLPMAETLSRLRGLGVVSAADLRYLKADWKGAEPRLGLAYVDGRKFAELLDRLQDPFAPPATALAVSAPATPAPALAPASPVFVHPATPATPPLSLPPPPTQPPPAVTDEGPPLADLSPGSSVPLDGHPRNLTNWPGVGLVVTVAELEDWECSAAVFVLGRDGGVVRRLGCAGDGPGQLEGPYGVAVDREGRLVVSDWLVGRLVVFERDGSVVRSLGSRGSGKGQFCGPRGVGVDGRGRVVVADWGNRRVQVLEADGSFVGLVGEGLLECPYGVAVDRAGRMLVSDWTASKVWVFGEDGSAERSFDCCGMVCGLSWDGWGRILAAKYSDHCLQVYAGDGSPVRRFGSLGSGPGQLDRPVGVWVESGRVVVADKGNKRVQVFEYE